MALKVHFEFDHSRLDAIAAELENLPSKRRDAISSIIHGGVLHNFNALSMGGSVPSKDGHDIRWLRVRSRMTIAIRARHGLGALFPILHLTGKLEGGLERGQVTGSGASLTYSPEATVLPLIRVHQLGLLPLASKSGRLFNKNVPPRTILFWSRQMADQVFALAEAAAKKR